MNEYEYAVRLLEQPVKYLEIQSMENENVLPLLSEIHLMVNTQKSKEVK